MLRALDSVIGPFAEKQSFHGESGCFFYITNTVRGHDQNKNKSKSVFCNDFLPISAIFFTEIFLYIIIKKIRPLSI